MASRPARAASWDSNAVLTQDAKILPRKQGLATPGIGFCDPFCCRPSPALAPGLAAHLPADWNHPFARPDARQHVRGPRTALSRNPVGATLVPGSRIPKTSGPHRSAEGSLPIVRTAWRGMRQCLNSGARHSGDHGAPMNFASDNTAGAPPAILDAIARANAG